MEMWRRINSERIWDKEPVFCLTADVDWAPESALEIFFSEIHAFGFRPTIFVTNLSQVVEDQFQRGLIDRGLHPNFLPGSSHGSTLTEVFDTVRQFAPETRCFRAHRGFDSTDSTHLVASRGIEYDSNAITLMQTRLQPTLLESGLVRFPVYLEDGTYLFRDLDRSFEAFMHHLAYPGIKVLSVHPMNWVINPPVITYMRSIKDSLSREDYNLMSHEVIEKVRHKGEGIKDFMIAVLRYASQFKSYSLEQLYELSLSEPNRMEL